MFVLGSDITIGGFVGVKPHEVKIDKSIFSYVDRATIKLPITARIIREKDAAIMTYSVETAKQFKEGDKVTIKLGYNGVLRTEFEGFISRINFTAPLEIECEGYSYQIRQKQMHGTIYKMQLKDVMRKVIDGTDIVLDAHIPNFEIAKLMMEGKRGTDILHEIENKTEQCVKFFFTGNVLYGGLQYLKYKADVKYQLGWNVIKDNNLKKREAKNEDIITVVMGQTADGTKIKTQTGTKGVKKITTTHFITDKDSLQQYSDAKHAKQSFDGYEGKITAFGVPYCEPGYRAILLDETYKEREGHYLVDSTEISYGVNGFRRIVGIGIKL